MNNILKPNKIELDCAIIGCGRVAPNHYFGLNNPGYSRVKWACDSNPTPVVDFAKKYDVPFNTIDFNIVLQDPDVDIVSIATDHYQHFSLTAAALSHHKHVLVEKPMALNVTDAALMIELAHNNNVNLSVISQHRFDPLLQKIKEIIDKNALGKITTITANLICGRPKEYYSESYWRGLAKLEGGSALINQGYHVVDTMLWLVGDVLQVECYANRILHQNVIETEDTIAAVMYFQNGAIGSLSITSVYLEKDWETSFEIIGTLGRIRFDLNYPNKVDLWEIPSIPLESLGKFDYTCNLPGIAYYGTSHVNQIQNFVQAIINNTQPALNPVVAQNTLKTILDIYRAAHKNGFVLGDVTK